MGGGPYKEHLLITLYFEVPDDAVAHIRKRFPYIEITSYPLERQKKFKDGTQHRKEEDDKLKGIHPFLDQEIPGL